MSYVEFLTELTNTNVAVSNFTTDDVMKYDANIGDDFDIYEEMELSPEDRDRQFREELINDLDDLLK